MARMLVLVLITEWFWRWKRMGMHRNDARTHRLSCKALGTQACGQSLERKDPLEALKQGKGDVDDLVGAVVGRD